MLAIFRTRVLLESFTYQSCEHHAQNVGCVFMRFYPRPSLRSRAGATASLVQRFNGSTVQQSMYVCVSDLHLEQTCYLVESLNWSQYDVHSSTRISTSSPGPGSHLALGLTMSRSWPLTLADSCVAFGLVLAVPCPRPCPSWRFISHHLHCPRPRPCPRLHSPGSVSYTHLTLPTICSV